MIWDVPHPKHSNDEGENRKIRPTLKKSIVRTCEKMGSPPFLIGQSEWTNILVFITTSYGLSIEIFKFKI
jgi:hypothetical protein